MEQLWCRYNLSVLIDISNKPFRENVSLVSLWENMSYNQMSPLDMYAIKSESVGQILASSFVPALIVLSVDTGSGTFY